MTTLDHSAGVTLFEIQSQITELRIIWEPYNQIFCVKHKDPLPFDIAPRFFYAVYKAFQENIIAIIVRLFDPKENRNRDQCVYNISFDYLLDQLIREDFPNDEIKKLREKVDLFKQKYRETIFKFRNKRLGHNDYLTIRKYDFNSTHESLYTVPQLIEAVNSVFDLTNDFEDLLMRTKKQSENSQDFYANPHKTDFSQIAADADKLIEGITKILIQNNKYH